MNSAKTTKKVAKNQAILADAHAIFASKRAEDPYFLTESKSELLDDARYLETSYVISLIGKEAPNELIVQAQNICGIGSLKDIPPIRRIDMAFNFLKTLKGISQLPQLRHLSAYCCGIANIDDLAGCKYMETMMLQQNELSEFPSSFASLNKLKELRVDRNKIASIDNLQACTSLRVLNISSNKLTSLEGLAGLQSLQELRADNNQIKSLLCLRALPSLREIDISNNHLSSLDGIQKIPTLECVRAEYNNLVTLQISQTYSYQTKLPNPADSAAEEKQLARTKKDAGGGKSVSGTSVTTARGSTTGTSRSGATTSRMVGTASKLDKSDKVQVLGMPALSEVFVSNNNIQSLKGIDSLGIHLENLDIRNNFIGSIEDILTPLCDMAGQLTKLTEISFSGNPLGVITDDMMSDLVLTFVKECPNLKNIDNFTIVTQEESKSKKYAIASSDNNQFHTWDDDTLSVTSGETSTRLKARVMDMSSIQSLNAGAEIVGVPIAEFVEGLGRGDDDDVKDELDADEGDIDFSYNANRNIPKLNVKHVKTAEEVARMEDNIAALLTDCKEVLKEMLMLPPSDVDGKAMNELYKTVIHKKSIRLGKSFKIKMQKDMEDALKAERMRPKVVFLPPEVSDNQSISSSKPERESGFKQDDDQINKSIRIKPYNGGLTARPDTAEEKEAEKFNTNLREAIAGVSLGLKGLSSAECIDLSSLQASVIEGLRLRQQLSYARQQTPRAPNEALLCGMTRPLTASSASSTSSSAPSVLPPPPSSILGSGVTRHGTKIKSKAQVLSTNLTGSTFDLRSDLMETPFSISNRIPAEFDTNALQAMRDAEKPKSIIPTLWKDEPPPQSTPTHTSSTPPASIVNSATTASPEVSGTYIAKKFDFNLLDAKAQAISVAISALNNSPGADSRSLQSLDVAESKTHIGTGYQDAGSKIQDFKGSEEKYQSSSGSSSSNGGSSSNSSNITIMNSSNGNTSPLTAVASLSISAKFNEDEITDSPMPTRSPRSTFKSDQQRILSLLQSASVRSNNLSVQESGLSPRPLSALMMGKAGSSDSDTGRSSSSVNDFYLTNPTACGYDPRFRMPPVIQKSISARADDENQPGDAVPGSEKVLPRSISAPESSLQAALSGDLSAIQGMTVYIQSDRGEQKLQDSDDDDGDGDDTDFKPITSQASLELALGNAGSKGGANRRDIDPRPSLRKFRLPDVLQDTAGTDALEAKVLSASSVKSTGSARSAGFGF